ncbi:MAG: stage II sporulation protein R [Firmicutes bacterium]|nr:stage II sporulation protein R [Bacillota bacterium]
MKKILIIISIILAFTLITQNVKAEDVMIPNEAIRFRVLANSNSVYDQQVKMDVAMSVQDEIYEILKNQHNIDNAKIILQDNIPRIESVVEKIFKEKSYLNTFKVEYGYHYFPEKEYKGIKYNEGEYESLLITLGEGKGDNWWCVLFPPLCLIEAEESSETEYKFFIQELIEKYL